MTSIHANSPHVEIIGAGFSGLITGIRGSRIEDASPGGMIARNCWPTLKDSGPISVRQALQKDNLNRQASPQHV